MMYWGNGDWNWTAWVAMTLGMVLFWGLVAWLLVTLVRHPRDNGRTALDLLDERFARGEIDEDEYRRRRDALRSNG